LRQFLVEPFVPHPDGTEYYININSQREVCFNFSSLNYPDFLAARRVAANESRIIWDFRREVEIF
jgi:hypothetical protein